MKSSARVVIIGGGIAGCSLAYHLTNIYGWSDVVLLDKGQLTSGSTWHAAGIVTVFHTSPSLMRMRKYSMDLYKKLQADGGDQVGWRTVGSLRVASTPDHFKFLQRQVSQGKAIGLDLEIISPEESLRHYPLMSKENLYGAMYLPGDGYLDPSGVTYELAQRAKAKGATMYTDTRVTGITLDAKRNVRAVQTDQGEIQTEIVVNAAGMWAPRLGSMVGVHLPMTPLTHQHLQAKVADFTLPKDTPVLRDPAHLVYIREEQGGFLIGGFEIDPVAHFTDGAPWEFNQQLFPPDWELFDPILQGAIKRVPIIEKAEAVMLLNGPEAITPDSRPLLGPVPGLRGYYVAAGLSHTGFGGGGAIGQIVAEWIVEGEPSQDTQEYNVRRFGEIYRDAKVTAERAIESYKYYYFLRFPHDENESTRPLRLSPLDARLGALGAVWGEKNGWERVNYFDPGTLRASRRMGADQRAWGWGKPAFFEQVGAEHRAVRERVGIFEMSSFGKIDVKGKGALALMQKLTDSNLDKPVGRVVYTQFLNARGGIESDLTITRLADEHFRATTGSAFLPRDLGWITMHLPDDGSVEVKDVTTEWATIGMWGPRARDVLSRATRDDVSNSALPYMAAKQIKIADVDVIAQRVTYVGELGWEMYLPTNSATQVWDALIAAGKEFGIQPCGYKALESLRLEKGYRYWTADITPADNPYEAGLGFCVHLNKGEFIGRQALVKAKAQGLTRKLSTLTLNGSAAIYGGEAISANGKVVARLRSGGYGYTIGKNVGLAYLPLDLAKDGTPVSVEVFGEHIAARVDADVLYDAKMERIKA